MIYLRSSKIDVIYLVSGISTRMHELWEHTGWACLQPDKKLEHSIGKITARQ